MCGGKGGSGGGSSFTQPSPMTTSQSVNQATQQQQTYTPNPMTQYMGNLALGMAGSAATATPNIPQQPVAGFTPMQQQYFSQLLGLQGMTDPYFSTARNYMGQGANYMGQGAGLIGQGSNIIGQGVSGIGAGQNIMGMGIPGLQQAGTPTTAADINNYMNPFADSTLAAMKKYVFDPQRTQTMGQQTQMAGGVGADRLALASQNLDKTQADAIAQAQAGFWQPAMNMAQQQKQMALQSGLGFGTLGQGYGGLGAATGGLGAQMGGLGSQMGGIGSAYGSLGSAYGGLGTSALNAALQGTTALGAAGTQQQQLAQAQLMAPYNQQLAYMAYPFQTAQFLSGLTGGLAPALGGTTAGTGATQGTGFGTQMPSQPSRASQIFGLGAGILGGLGSAGIFNNLGSGKGSSPYAGPFGNYMGYTDVSGMPIFGPGFRLGGKIINPFAKGGEVDDDSSDGVSDSGVPDINVKHLDIPHYDLPMGTGEHAGARLNLNPDVKFPLPWAVQQNQQSGGSGSGGTGSGIGSAIGAAISIGAKVLPFLLASGGSVNPFAGGGSVTPFDAGRGFAPQEDKPWSPLDVIAPVNKGSPFNVRNAFIPQPTPPASFNERFITPQQSPAISASPLPIVDADTTGLGKKWEPSAPPSKDAEDLDDADTTEIAANQRKDQQYLDQLSPMDASHYTMPRDRMPYPDSLQRDWGQQAVRSPWMSLIAAGAKVAGSTKPFMSALAEGIGAGAGELESQRKELRTEEALNQRAEGLFQHAQSLVDKYTRKTPHEIATEKYRERQLDAERWSPVGAITKEGGHPVIYDRRSGRTIDSVTREPIMPDQELVTTRGPGAGRLERDAQYLVKVGAAKTEAEAVGQLRHSLLDPSKRAAAIANWTKIILANDPSIGGNVDSARRRAESMVTQDLSGSGGGNTPAPAGTQDNPMPYVQGSQPQKGLFYRMPDGTVRQAN